MFFVKLPQNRHPERSASPIARVIQRLWRGVEGPRRRYLTHAVRSFSTTEPAPGWAATVVPRGREPTSTFSAAIQARFTLASPATCISVSCNIRRARGKVSLRPMAASACSTLKATKIFAQPSLGKTAQRLAARKEAQPHSHDQSRVQRPCTDLGMEDDYSA